jgi:hypothetical protein
VLASEIFCLVARVAAHSVHAVAIFAALHILQVLVAVISLQRRIARRMAILAARRCQYAVHLKESGARDIHILLPWASGQRSGK